MIKKSLKKEILQKQIYFAIFVISFIGLIAILNQYNSKIEERKLNQKFVLSQIDQEIENLTSKMQVISKYISSNYSFSSDLLKNVVDTNNNISSILILDNKGIIEDFYAISNQNIYKGFDYSNKDYFTKLKTKSFYWSDVFLSTVDESPTLSYSFRMNDKIGVFMIDVSELSTFILKFKNRDGSHMVRILDSNGIMIINPDAPRLVLERFNAKSSEVFTKLIAKNEPYTQDIFKDKEGKSNQFGAYIKSQKTGWYVVLREDHNYILKSLNFMIYSFVAAILFFIIISIIISLRISRNIFKSFDDMQNTTSRIASGNYDVKSIDLPYEEFNKLLRSFNKMQIEIDKREDNLENSLNSFKSLFNSTMESIVLTKNGLIIDVNNVSLSLFKAKNKEELIGKNLIDFVLPKYKELVLSQANISVEPYEVELFKVDGSSFQALAQGKFLDLQNDKIRVSAIIDITELKNKDKLLFQQSKMASMGEMIENIAHQWRQPLSMISTCASGVKLKKEYETLSNENLLESMDMIVQNTQYLSRTIDDFRNFFKSDKHVEEFEVSEVIDKALVLLSSTLKNNEITIIKKYSDKKTLVEGFPNEFIQVIINLINNSKDAFISNNIKERYIEISEINDKNLYKLNIKDNAGGISSKIIDKIFDPYFTTKHKYQGTGIGLYMSHQIIVENMKGNIFVKNSDLKIENIHYSGCTFTIEFNN